MKFPGARARRAVLVVGASLAGAASAPMAHDWLVYHPYFAVEEVDFIGQRRLSEAELGEWSGLGRGISIFRVDPTRLERRLARHPWIRSARIERVPPRRVVARISERKPLAIVRLPEMRYLDERGRLMGELFESDSHDYPIVSGLSGTFGRASPDVALPRIAHLLRRLGEDSWLGHLSEVHVDPEHGMTLFPVEMRVAVIIGWDRWRAKLRLAEAVLSEWRGREEEIAAIDLSAGEHALLRLRRVPGEPAPARGKKTRV